MRRMTKAQRKELEQEITAILCGAVSSDYSRYILRYRDIEDDDGDTIMDDIVDDVLSSSAWDDEGYYNDDDIRLAIGRVIMRRIGIDV